MNFNDFANKYTSKNNFVIPDLISEAEKNLQALENQVQLLQSECAKYKQFIKEISLKTKNNYNDSFDYYCNFNVLNDNYQKIIDKIIKLFDSDNEIELSTKDIINKVFNIEHHSDVLKSLQWLINKSILNRNLNFKFIKGDKWQSKNLIIN